MHLPTFCLVILCSLTSGIHIRFQAEIDCDIPGAYWCGELNVLEKDVIVHDLLKQDKFCTSERTKTVKYTIDAEDDFPTDNFEIFYKFNHNCSANGKTYCVKPRDHKEVDLFRPKTVYFNIEARPNAQPYRCKAPWIF
ncbi:TransThyretin-Related family domain [Caenorhabditis elegans]|uniref:TransThyretin-Related family domain n=1 Tax=Caenorhabditis elegans TaxID=6239 RepID=Q20093_CAEEL|nr:TransThyretin-Related family domain [Caenorhabditis elegans]CCD69525.1 TransThyretin-Related family domain [Caenorhabditis elegans]|eukprot:NP_500526.1 Uncharacterized protein CELE_F36A4.4 [Caenorhabditis elegans]